MKRINLDKIKEILSTLSSNGDLILPDSLNGITAEIPPSKFDSDISTNSVNHGVSLPISSIVALDNIPMGFIFYYPRFFLYNFLAFPKIPVIDKTLSYHQV